MKRFITSVFLLSLVTLLLYPLLLFLWGLVMPSYLAINLNDFTGGYGHMNSRIKEIKEVRDVDVLIVGSSLAYRGFDTRIFQKNGIYAFNLGSISQTPLQTRVLLKRYLDRLHPKLIIYVVDADAFTSDGVESALDVISNDRNDMYSLKMAIQVNHIRVYNTMTYKLIRQCLGLDKTFTEPLVKDDDVYIPGGFVEKKITYFRKKSYEKQTWIFREKQLDAFGEVMQMIKSKGIEVILVNPPVTSSYYASFSNNHVFDSLMRSSGDYINYNHLITLDDSLDFFDHVHLNQSGVGKFNQYILDLPELSRFRTRQ